MFNKPFLLDEHEISCWAFLYCYYTEDKPEIRELITTDLESYMYCFHINDDPEIRKNITDPKYSFLYCLNIKDRPEMRKNLDGDYAWAYCNQINCDQKVSKKQNKFVDELKIRSEIHFRNTMTKNVFSYKILLKDIKDRGY